MTSAQLNGSNSRVLAASWQYPRHRAFEETLREAATKWFDRMGFERHPKYSYCLGQWNDWEKNIIDSDVAKMVANLAMARHEQGQNFPLHKYVHHGLSSQAFLFNLVGPLILAKDLEPLRNAAEEQGIEWPGVETLAEFEYEEREVFNEDAGQPTSIDLVIKNNAGVPRLFIECKLVEKEFGGCSVFAEGDCDGRNPAKTPELCYLHHIGRRYWDLMRKHGFLQSRLGHDSTCVFSTYYQFFREVLFALEKGGTFILLNDERSPTFFCKGPKGDRGLMPFLLGFVPEQHKRHIGQIPTTTPLRTLPTRTNTHCTR